ncbi:MAG TPA: hypothetical protein VMN79_09530 [Casimicrobiaceae bacterium]|nr:hypothetical protein [Casimicrobiaceae bacterium]
MKKLLIALFAGAFALGSVALMAQTPQGDKTPPEPVDQAKLKAERDAARKAKANMTPEQKKAARAKHQQETTATSKEGDTGNKAMQQAQDKANAQASKTQPKALPDKAAKQKALTEQEKASSKAGGQ